MWFFFYCFPHQQFSVTAAPPSDKRVIVGIIIMTMYELLKGVVFKTMVNQKIVNCYNTYKGQSINNKNDFF